MYTHTRSHIQTHTHTHTHTLSQSGTVSPQRQAHVMEEEQCDGGGPGIFGSFGLYYTLILIHTHTHTHTLSHTHSQSGTVSPHRQAQGAASMWSLRDTLEMYSSLEQGTCCQ